MNVFSLSYAHLRFEGNKGNKRWAPPILALSLLATSAACGNTGKRVGQGVSDSFEGITAEEITDAAMTGVTARYAYTRTRLCANEMYIKGFTKDTSPSVWCENNETPLTVADIKLFVQTLMITSKSPETDADLQALLDLLNQQDDTAVVSEPVAQELEKISDQLANG